MEDANIKNLVMDYIDLYIYHMGETTRPRSMISWTV